jgi:hypothetical protein
VKLQPLILSLGVSAALIAGISVGSARRSAESGGALRPLRELVRTDTIGVLVVSSLCQACTAGETIGRVRAAHVNFRQTPTRRTIGVALDEDLTAGMRLLRRYGNFDELVVGGSWTNVVALSHVWADTAGLAAVPQLILLERAIGRTSDARLVVDGERVLGRAYGVREITRLLSHFEMPAP